MKVLEVIKGGLRSLLRRETANVSLRGGAKPLWIGSDTAMNVATVYRCVKLLSDSVASLPLHHKVKRGNIFEVDADSGIEYLLSLQPNEWTNAFDFWRQAVYDILVYGNAYIVPQYSPATMQIERLVLCRPALVQHDTTGDTYRVNEDKVVGVYDENEIIHLKGLPGSNPKTGLSVLSFARLTSRIATAGDRETLSRFENGGNMRVLLSNTKSGSAFTPYQPDQLDEVANDLSERLNNERVVTIPGQAQATPMSLSSADMQFLQSRKFTVIEICRFFGVHPSMVFEDTSSNYKSAEQASVAFLTHTLNPMLRSIEIELQRKLCPPKTGLKHRFEFDRRGLYACDLDSKMRYVRETIAAGIYTVNEWRLEENKPAVDGGDTPFVSANLKPIIQQINNGK